MLDLIPIDRSLFELHFEHLPGPAYMWRRTDDDFVLIAHNKAAARHPFSKAASIVNTTASSLTNEYYDLAAGLKRCFASEQVIKDETEFLFVTTGTLRHVEITFVPLTSERLVVAHLNDVTERKAWETALMESELKFRSIVDNAHEGIWAIDRNSTTTLVNKRAAEILGYTREEIVDRSVLDFMFEEDREKALRLRSERVAGNRFDFKMRHKDGSTVWVSVSGAPRHNEAGEFDGAITMIADITARKFAEQALRDSEARLRALLESHPDMIVRVSRDGTYLDAHIPKHSKESVPYGPEYLIGRNVRDILDPDEVVIHQRMREAALDTGQLQIWELNRLVDGKMHFVEARFVRSGEDEIVATLRDVTDWRRTQRALMRSAARLEALTEAAFDGVCISRDGRIIETSARFAKTLGYSTDELKGVEVAEIIAEPARATHAAHDTRDRSTPYLIYLLRKDGSILPAEACGANHSDDGEILRVLAIRDVTSRTRLEQEVIEISEREQTRIGRDLHDGLGQTLTGISLSLGSLAKRLNTNQAAASEELDAIAKLLAVAISDVRRIAKTLTPDIESLGGFRRALESLAQDIKRSNSIDCRVTIGADCSITDESVATHIYRITQEALSNAVRHSGATLIELDLKRAKGVYSLEIADNGRGISVDLETAEGMGFKNMRYRAHSLNGTIETKAKRGGGTRVVCRFLAEPSWTEHTTLRRA